MFYYTLGNIRPVYRSNLKAIQLLCIAKSSDIRAYGVEKLLQPFIQQMSILGKVCLTLGSSVLFYS